MKERKKEKKAVKETAVDDISKPKPIGIHNTNDPVNFSLISLHPLKRLQTQSSGQQKEKREKEIEIQSPRNGIC